MASDIGQPRKDRHSPPPIVEPAEASRSGGEPKANQSGSKTNERELDTRAIKAAFKGRRQVFDI
jgi:hypothetical protein